MYNKSLLELGVQLDLTSHWWTGVPKFLRSLIKLLLGRRARPSHRTLFCHAVSSWASFVLRPAFSFQLRDLFIEAISLYHCSSVSVPSYSS
ncbi:hypothetical protein WAI453_007880 [Rhynchosporium graminicola]